MTFMSEEFPVFWDRAEGTRVIDVDGNEYIDLTAAFGVAAVGHSNPVVLAAAEEQMKRLAHGMGDVHPSEPKVRLAETLAELLPGDLEQSIFSLSGSEAVESAFKTACLSTGKPGILAFEGAYHGLSYGALAATWREDFRSPFSEQLGRWVRFAPYPNPYRGCSVKDSLRAVKKELGNSEANPIGAIIVEPIQGRGGNVAPPKGFLSDLKEICEQNDLLLIMDEIFTGLGRTGSWFAADYEGITPDLICLGKALGGGFPISACVGTTEVMSAWPESTGEAIHTSTFLGHPVGCAAGIAVIEEIRRKNLVDRSREMGEFADQWLQNRLGSSPIVGEIRGRGLMIGIDLVTDRESNEPNPDAALNIMTSALRKGVMVLISGTFRNVLSLTPPLIIEEPELESALSLIAECIEKVGQT